MLPLINRDNEYLLVWFFFVGNPFRITTYTASPPSPKNKKDKPLVVTPENATVTLCLYGDRGKSQEIPLTLDVKEKEEEDPKKKKKGKKEEKLFAAGQKDVFMVCGHIYILMWNFDDFGLIWISCVHLHQSFDLSRLLIMSCFRPRKVVKICHDIQTYLLKWLKCNTVQCNTVMFICSSYIRFVLSAHQHNLWAFQWNMILTLEYIMCTIFKCQTGTKKRHYKPCPWLF